MPESNPDTVSRLEQRHMQLVKDTRRVYGRQQLQQHLAQQRARAALDDDDRWFGAALFEDAAHIVVVLLIVVLCALAGVYGIGLRDLAWGLWR